jgi:hypothetical protein
MRWVQVICGKAINDYLDEREGLVYDNAPVLPYRGDRGGIKCLAREYNTLLRETWMYGNSR